MMNLLQTLFFYLILLVHCLLGHGLQLNSRFQTFRTAISSTEQIIRKHGFLVAKYQVQTSDGYILSTYRIPSNVTGTKDPVLLLGPLSSTPSEFAIYDDSLAYVLARKGYDVWLGNVRGNVRDSKHVKHSQLSTKFWDFSWDEMAAHDLPSTIDYILSKTGHDRLSVVSTSISTTYTSALLATKPEYNVKVRRHIGLAPVLYGRYTSHLLFKPLAKFHVPLRIVDDVFNNGLVTLIVTRLLYYGGTLFCTFFTDGCELIFLFFSGYTPIKHGNYAAMIFAHLMEGASLKTYIHLFQLINEGPMRRYDYGSWKNLVKYKTKTAPIYNLTRISTATSLFHGANDDVATPLVVGIAAKQIPNVKVELFSNRMFIHSDYVDTANVSQLNLVNRKILEHLQIDV